MPRKKAVRKDVTTTLKVHPVALLMPEMTELQYMALRDDIKARGLRTPIILAGDGRIADGRHRYKACRELGIEPNFVRSKYKSDADLAREVVSLNLKRRHLSESQEGLVSARLIPLFEAEARERMEKGRAAGTKATKERVQAPEVPEKTKKTKKGSSAKLRSSLSEEVVETTKKSARKAATDAANAVGCSTRQTEHGVKVLKSCIPEVVAAVDRDELAIHQAAKLGKYEPEKQRLVWNLMEKGEAKNVIDGLRKIMISEQKAKIAAAPPVVGSYGVLVVDPPWTFAKTREDDSTQRGRTPYPTMTEAEIKAIKLPIEADAIVWLWVTNAHLLSGEALRVLEAWGLQAKGIVTWAKNKMGTGDWLRGQTEHVILAVKGKPVFDQPVPSTLLAAKVGQHSEKPDEFYAMVEAYCPGTKGELFSRKERKGWTQHGVELGSIPSEPEDPIMEGFKAAKRTKNPPPADAVDPAEAALLAAKAKYAAEEKHKAARAAKVPRAPVPIIPPQPAGTMPPIVPNS